MDALDQPAVLRTDLVVEGDVVGDPGLIGVRCEEVVEVPIGAIGGERDDRADREVEPPWHYVDRRVGEEEMELTASDLAFGVVDAAATVPRGSELAQERRTRLERVRV